MRVSILLSPAFVILLSACTSATLVQESKFENAGEVVCRDVVPVGSHLKERVCTTVADSKEESTQARRALEEVQQRRDADALLQRGGRRPEGP